MVNPHSAGKSVNAGVPVGVRRLRSAARFGVKRHARD